MCFPMVPRRASQWQQQALPLGPHRLPRSGNLFRTDSPPQRPGQQHIPDGSPLQRPGQQQTSSGGEKDSGLASNLAHLGRIC